MIRTAILPSTAPATGSRNLLTIPNVKRSERHAPKITDAAEHLTTMKLSMM